MQVRTFRADTIQEALAQIRRELGPAAAVLHTREVPSGRWFRRWSGGKQVEVTASNVVNVPSRIPPSMDFEGEPRQPATAQQPQRDLSREATTRDHAGPANRASDGHGSPRENPRDELKDQIENLQSMVENLVRRYPRHTESDLPEEWFHLYTDLIEADIPEEVVRDLVERVRTQPGEAKDATDPLLLKVRVVALLEAEIATCGPIQFSAGRRHTVALVGPTGVGKTTTIAKLAANFRLRAKRNVGLITVDTYRIAAVEQLRTYADIIDLPMQVVSTPREMRQAVEQFAHLDLVLIDTAGRSPRDEVKIQELRALLAEAQADEVHLVLSSVAGAAALKRTAERFATVGTTALLLTKLDEATSLGNVLPVLRACGCPLSYLTNGQNVPDDIEAAVPGKLAREIVGLTDDTAKVVV